MEAFEFETARAALERYAADPAVLSHRHNYPLFRGWAWRGLVTTTAMALGGIVEDPAGV